MSTTFALFLDASRTILHWDIRLLSVKRIIILLHMQKKRADFHQLSSFTAHHVLFTILTLRNFCKI
jgi:hypothetical protein